MRTEINRLYSAAEVRELDRIAIQEAGMAGISLMKRAGQAAFETLEQRYPTTRSICVFCGKGNNAGDGYILAGLARQRGLSVSLLQLGDTQLLEGDAATACHWAQTQGVHPLNVSSVQDLKVTADVVVDALLGTGLSGAVRAPYDAAIDAINLTVARDDKKVLALDLPSGLSADTGEILGCAVRADVTVTFIAAKRGLFTAAGPDYAGEVLLDDLGVSRQVIARVPGIPALRWALQSSRVPRRRRTIYKHGCGHLVVCGGEQGLGGAVAMAAEAALRVGTGMVTVLTRERHVPAILARRPELMVRGVAEDEFPQKLLARASAIVVGPGLGRSRWSKMLLQQAVAAAKPLLIDADGLNLLSAGESLSEVSQLTSGVVITPHSGEAARLLKTTSETIQHDRFAAVQALSRRYQAVTVLKGPGTLVAAACRKSSDRVLGLCMHGNPAMATAGMGDVLSGVIGGFLAQGLASSDAATTGVCLHSYAADRWVAVEGERGLLATDLIALMRRILNSSAITPDDG